MVISFEAPKPQDFQFRIEKIIGQERSNADASGIDIQFRRGDIRFFLLNPTRFQDCAKLWHECMNTHTTQLKGLFEHALPKWAYSDLAMFCLHMARTTEIHLQRMPFKEMLRISDTDLVRQTSPKFRAAMLSSWFETHIRVKLEQWPPLA